jgi:hypothetical protein
MLTLNEISKKIDEAEKALDEADMRCNIVEQTYIEAEAQRAQAWKKFDEFKNLKALLTKPLTATWESGQLEELQKRFPEGVFVLTTSRNQFKIKAHGMAIYSVNPNIVCCTFEQFDSSEWFQLTMKWRGLYIDLSHHFFE